jgi:hypothetical protein
MLHTVIETPAYLRESKQAGMTEDEREFAVLFLAENPKAGDIMKGTGGCRKVRIAKEGHGKSGGYRVITNYGGNDIPVFLLTAFSKGQKINLSRAQRNALATLTGTLKASLSSNADKSRKQK